MGRAARRAPRIPLLHPPLYPAVHLQLNIWKKVPNLLPALPPMCHSSRHGRRFRERSAQTRALPGRSQCTCAPPARQWRDQGVSATRSAEAPVSPFTDTSPAWCESDPDRITVPCATRACTKAQPRPGASKYVPRCGTIITAWCRRPPPALPPLASARHLTPRELKIKPRPLRHTTSRIFNSENPNRRTR